MIKVINCKNWCEENITPMAWPRVVLRVVPELRQKGYSVKEMENPTDSVTVDEETFKIFNEALKTIYEMEIPQAVAV